MIDLDFQIIQQLGYIFSAMLFIYGLKMLSKEDTAARGNLVSSTGMFLAVLVTIVEIINPLLVISAIVLGGLIGSLFALKVKMTSIPEMVALFNGFGGLSSFFLAWSEFNNLTTSSLIMLITYATVIIGGVTFSGSVIAFLKLSEMFFNIFKPFSSPMPVKESILDLFAFLYDALNMRGISCFLVISKIFSAIWYVFSSSSITHGPAIKKNIFFSLLIKFSIIAKLLSFLGKFKYK